MRDIIQTLVIGIAIIGAFLLALCIFGGCVSAPNTASLPPLPPMAKSGVSRPKTALSKPLSIYLTWDDIPGVEFEVWSTGDLRGVWTLQAVVKTNRLAIGGLPQQYFRVRSLDRVTGLVSGWGTVGMR